jgi:hypothetical protein
MWVAALDMRQPRPGVYAIGCRCGQSVGIAGLCAAGSDLWLPSAVNDLFDHRAAFLEGFGVKLALLCAA